MLFHFSTFINLSRLKYFLPVFLFSCLLSGCLATASKSDNRNVNSVRLMQTDAGVQITADDNILFDIGSATISKSGNTFIDKVAEILINKASTRVSIEGHTDSTGEASLNMSLSDRRSASVKQAFIKRKISSSRMVAKGFGQERPIADNESEDGRQMNRRSEIIILGETVEGIGGNATLDMLTEALGNFIKDSGAVISSTITSISRSIGDLDSKSKKKKKEKR